MKKIILLCLILAGVALLWIPRGPALPPGLTFAQITNPSASGSGTVTSVLGTANQITSDGNTTTPTLSIPSAFIGPGSIAATTSIGAKGATSGTWTCTPPAIAGTSTNGVACTNVFLSPDGAVTTPTYSFANSPATGLWQTGNFAILTSSGSQLYLQVSGASKFFVNANNFDPFTNGTQGLGEATQVFATLYTNLFNTGNNCSGAGTAASPSVVTCTAAPVGAFSCATNATGATCQVNTTAAHTNSDIQITPTASAGTRLSVTCNTTADTPTGPRIASINNGVSFTINLGTVSTNPTCYFYTIIN